MIEDCRSIVKRRRSLGLVIMEGNEIRLRRSFTKGLHDGFISDVVCMYRGWEKEDLLSRQSQFTGIE